MVVHAARPWRAGVTYTPGERFGGIALSHRTRRIIPSAILLLLCLCLLAVVTRQAVRAGLEARTTSRVRTGEAIGVRPWMTIPYIARTYHVPEETLFATIGVPPSRANDHVPLGTLAGREGRDIDDDVARLNDVIDRARQQRPATPATPGTTP